MDTSNHYTMQTLFEQLGLPSKAEQIDAFISENQLKNHERIEHASFWSSAQTSFIVESIREDSDWVILVEQLDLQLHQ